MAFFFGDGFDLYSQITDCGSYWDAALGASVTLALSSSGRFAGSRGVTLVALQSTTPYIAKTSSVNDAVHHVSVAVQQSGALSGTSVGAYFTLYDGATAQCSVVFRSDGAIVLASGAANGTALATYTGAVAATSTWYQFEIEVVINNTTGSIAVRKNGNTSNDFFLGSLNTRASANNYANKIGFGNFWVSAGSQTVDDFLWRSDASSLPWLGDIRCYTRMPASDAAVAWSPQAGAVAQTPFVPNSTLNIPANVARYAPFTARATGSIGTVTVNVTTTAATNLKCAIFSNNAGAPGTVLGTASPVAMTGLGTLTFTFSSPPAVTAGTSYYVGTIGDTTSGVVGGMSVAQAAVLSSGTPVYASWPVNNPTGISANSFPMSPTIFISPTGNPNSAQVSEAQQDGAATYVYSSTVGQSDLYNLGALSATPGSIIGVTTRAYLQKSDAGTRIAAVQLQSGAANVQGSLTLNTVWGWASRNDLVDPATGAAWTATAVNNAQVGVTVTT